MNIVRAIIIAVLLGVAACGRPHAMGVASGPEVGIVGGQVASSKDWISHSAVAILVISPRGKDPEHIIGTCSGTLIGEKLVVTAAHCVQDHLGPANGKPVSNPKTKFAVFFAPQLSFAELTAEIKAKMFTNDARVRLVPREQTRVKPGFIGVADDNVTFAAQAQNDVALLKLSTPAPANYQAMHVLRNLALVHPGSPVIIAGFGPTKSDDLGKGEKLRFLSTTIQKTLTPDTKQAELNTTNGHGLISGDSGGPGYIRVGSQVYVWGAASAAFDDGSDATYESLPFDYGWILSAARELGASLK